MDTITPPAPEATDIDAELTKTEYTQLSEDSPFEACDAHVNPDIRAVVMIKRGVFELTLCGNCARKFGYEHTAHSKQENRQQGSDH